MIKKEFNINIPGIPQIGAELSGIDHTLGVSSPDFTGQISIPTDNLAIQPENFIGGNIFKYPSGDRMCSSGQRRAALEAANILWHPETDRVGEEILHRAIIGEQALLRGADTNKHNLISYVVMERLCAGTLPEVIDPNTGNFTLRTYDGSELPRNIIEELLTSKRVF